jgi:hypothetical protein
MQGASGLRSGAKAEQDKAGHDQHRSPDLLAHQPLPEDQQAADAAEGEMRVTG